tara:strand:+ start:1072 stop:1560 length:489 start_codon:yes stop_codon:yes gene_type:complete
MARGADVIDKAGKELLKGIPKLREPLEELLPNLKNVAEGDATIEEIQDITRILAPGFFTKQAADCLPLIAECVKALGKLPPATPPTAKIQRKWVEDINTKLRKLQSQTYPQLETNINTFYTVPEPASKVSAIGSIVSKLPGLIADFALMTVNLFKIKKALKR